MCLAVPGEILTVELRSGLRFATVRFGDVTREVCIETVPDAVVGDFVLVHVGFALAKIDRDEAERTLALLDSVREPEP